MTWTNYVNDAITWLAGGGVTAAAAVLVTKSKTLFKLIDLIADHTETKKDNEILAAVKSKAVTYASAVEPLLMPGNDQKKVAVANLIEWGKTINQDLSTEQANNYIEEAYQTVIKANKFDNDKMQEEQAAELAKVQEAVEADPEIPAIHLDDGDKVEINGTKYVLGSGDNGAITLQEKEE